MNIPKKSWLGFTLIELLVVIAIIAILAAILFPVFAQAKASAKKTKSISNAKQIVLAALAYSGDYDDHVVPYFAGQEYVNNVFDVTPPFQWWPVLISTYIKGGTINGTGPSHSYPYGDHHLIMAQDMPEVFFEPNEPFSVQATNIVYNDGAAYNHELGWGLSVDFAYFYGSANSYVWPDSGPSVNFPTMGFSECASPASNILFAETYDWGNGASVNRALALGVFSGTGKTWAAANSGPPGTVILTSGYSGPPGCANCWNGAWWTGMAPYNSSYQKQMPNSSAYALGGLNGTNQMSDPDGVENVAFADGHVKSVHFGAVCSGDSALAYWSVTGTNRWP